MGKILNAIVRFFKLSKQSNSNEMTIYERLDFKANAAKNRIWYRGDSYELEQFYKNTENNNLNFWGSNSSSGLEIRKIHLGICSMVINTLTNLVLSDLDTLEVADKNKNELWKLIAEDNNFENQLSMILTEALAIGECYVKIGFDNAVSKYPILEVVSADNVDHDYVRGRITTNKFYNYFETKNTTYVLEEIYGSGFIKYNLFDQKTGEKVSLDILPETEFLEDLVFNADVNLSAELKIFNSTRFVGRGAGIFDDKEDVLDAMDEIYSQWLESVRCSRTKTYIPENLIPKNAQGGYLLKPNPFDNKFIKIESDNREGGSNKITSESGDINTEDLLQAYVTTLDLLLQGIISPSTIGIDVKKLDNAEAQREKEKVTLYTRNMIIKRLRNFITEVLDICLKAYELQNGMQIKENEINVQFGEYSNPSFESLIETMSNINTPMSIESKVEEIWGNTKSDEWKRLEVERIKSERGIFATDLF